LNNCGASRTRHGILVASWFYQRERTHEQAEFFSGSRPARNRSFGYFLTVFCTGKFQLAGRIHKCMTQEAYSASYRPRAEAPRELSDARIYSQPSGMPRYP
jgi:hypothetical protein